ncbi:MAG TPA: PTS sugar transporter subunit IIA [bacterium]|nr:PTS sugar transporter subunit IIA [bacterium]
MKIKEILPKKNVIESMRARTRDEAVAELVDIIAGQVPLARDKLVRILIEREEQSPTAMTGGVAVPHGRIKELDRFVLALGRSKVGVPFGAKEGPIKIFFLLMAPTDDTVSHLKILARLARMCRNSAFRDDLLAAKNADELFERVMKEDEAV